MSRETLTVSTFFHIILLVNSKIRNDPHVLKSWYKMKRNFINHIKVWYLTATKDAPFLLAVWPCKDPEFTNVVELTESSMRKCNVLYDFKTGISTETSAICSEISLS